MIRRAILDEVRSRLARYPAVVLVGPRQSGKTTLARSLGGHYFDMEQPGEVTRLDVDWNILVDDNKRIILDEAQTCPVIFPRLRGAIDARRAENGRFLLLGSVSPALMKQVSESLAGRLAVVELTPLLADELPADTLDLLWLKGGFPNGGVLDSDTFPGWQRDYLGLLGARDLPNYGLPARPQVVDRLFHMVAAIHGQIWNATTVGQGLGLSRTTVNSYMDYLEGVFLVRCLRPYLPNLKKRLVKSPRYYWRDTGLLHAMLRTTTRNDLLRQPWVGASWEGFVIEQIIGRLQHLGVDAQTGFFRTSDGHEVDLVVDLGRELWAIQIKLTSQPSPGHLAELRKTGTMIHATRRVLISRTAQSVFGTDEASCSLTDFLTELKKWI